MLRTPNYCLIVEFSWYLIIARKYHTDDDEIAIDQENFTDLPPWPIFYGFGGSELESPSKTTHCLNLVTLNFGVVLMTSIAISNT